MSIPVVDFGACSLSKKDVTDEQMISLAEQLKEAFMEVGFVFLKNTGISKEEVDRVMDISKKFFLQSDELKQPFSRSTASPYNGWIAMESETLDQRHPAGLKEAFNMNSFHPDIKWPSGAAKGFQEIHTLFYQRCTELSLRVLRVMAHSLGLDPEVFLSAHRFIGTDENLTTLRTLYYPPVDREKVKDGQVRCGEHSDYGSISLLFQGSEGLQSLSVESVQSVVCTELSLRVLRVMAHSPGLDPEVLLSMHRLIGTDENLSTMRTAYYPPVDREKVKENQVRCAEHTDFGSIAMLFQGSEGLQVQKRNGEFISAPVIPGAVLVNISDMMQRWTCDQFISVRHRVLLPPAGDSSARQSVAFFLHPDNEVQITSLDGSNKYPPITSIAYITERFQGVYKE